MTVFRHPAFAKLSPKIARAMRETKEVETYLQNHDGEVSAGEWGAVSAVSLGIHNIYNGIEDIFLSLARDVDGLVPTGPTMHQDILDQMAAEISGIRPAVLNLQLHEMLTELKGFRHLIRHRYGFDLKADRVRDSLDRIRQALPDVVEAVVSLEKALLDSDLRGGR